MFEGRVWRHLPATGHPLDTGYILRASGRWNRPGLYGCLYTTLTVETAIAEFRKLLATYGAGPHMVSPRDLVSIDVRLDPVLDLRSQRVRRTLRMSPKDLRGDSPSDLEACRRVADWARAEGHVALLAPSAPDRSGTVLAIYPDMQPASGIEISLGPDRLPLNHSGSQLLS
jgi:RES domain-containing protein